MIVLEQVGKRYRSRDNQGWFTAVEPTSLTIHQGEIFGLMGHNGAGKSTWFKMMLGLVPATSGVTCS